MGQCEKHGEFEGRCVPCHRKYTAEWRLRNKEHISKYAQERRNDPAVRERERKTSREYGRAHREQKADALRRWIAANPVRYKELIRRQRANRTQLQLKRKAKMRGPSDPRVKAFYEIAHWLRSLGDNVHVDHIIPIALGGKHTHDNLQILPAIENMRKGARWIG